MPPLSIVILTCNRLGRLLRGLETLFPQLGPDDEVLLIDTGSTDGTRNYFQTWSHPALRFIDWQGEGSWAEIRNFGAREARSPLIAFLDDDCIPAEDWVSRGREGLATADAVGGTVQPVGIENWPEWWHPDMGWMVGISVPGHWGAQAGRYHYPFTANIFARTSALRAVPFQEIGGRLGGDEAARYLSGREDARWWHDLRIKGYCTRFDRELIVGHAIDPLRLELAYLRHRVALDGHAWALRQGHRSDIPQLAYQWYRHLSAGVGALFVQPESRRAHWHYHDLTRRRHGQALRSLMGGGRLAWLALQPWLASAALRHDFHLGKDSLRQWTRFLREVNPRQPQARRVGRVAILAFGFLGDLVILQGVLRGLMQALPRLDLYVIGPPSARIALGGIPRLNVTVAPNDLARPVERRDWLGRWLDQVRPDAIAAPYLHGDWGRAAVALDEPPRPIVSFDVDQGLERLRWIERLGVRVHKDLTLHESDNLCRLLEVAGLRCRPAEPVILVPPARRAVTREHAAAAFEGDGPLVMFSPDAGTIYKPWTDEAWQKVALRAMEETDWRIVVNASHGPSPLDSLAEKYPRRILNLRQAPLSDLTAWMTHCDALLTVDAGPQHLAHALSVPSLTLYGPMDERRWRDRWNRPIHQTIRGCTPDLTPEEKRGLPPNHEMTCILPDPVFERFRRLVALSAPLRAAG